MGREPSLRQIQLELAGAWTRAESSAQAWIRSDGRGTSRERQGVYIEAYFARLAESLAADFPAVALACGQERFARLVAAYLRSSPPRGPSLADAGAALAAYLARGWARRERMPWLADLAALEWAVVESFYSRAMRANEARVRLGLCPSARLLPVSWPVHELWRVRSDPRAFALARRRIRRRRVEVCLWRDVRQPVGVRVAALGKGEFATLRALRERAGLERACRLGGRSGLTPELAERAFGEWVASGLLVGTGRALREAALKSGTPNNARGARAD
jgi:hypothetical protein